MQKERSGDKAVASSRSFYQLKSADASGPAIASGNLDALRADTYSFDSRAGGVTALPSVRRAERTADASRELGQQSRYVGGRTFFQNGDKWIDSDVQKQVNAKRVQVQFGSLEYFDLLAKQPQAKSWLALGTKVEFTLGDTVYEVTD
jgi:hypothetical protein